MFINQINIELLNRGPIWLLDYSFYEWIIESTNRIIFPFMNLLVWLAAGTLDMLDCKVLTRQRSFDLMTMMAIAMMMTTIRTWMMMNKWEWIHEYNLPCYYWSRAMKIKLVMKMKIEAIIVHKVKRWLKKKHFEYKTCSLLCLEVRVFLCIVGYTDSIVTRYSTT